jgi:hypothetical protein
VVKGERQTVRCAFENLTPRPPLHARRGGVRGLGVRSTTSWDFLMRAFELIGEENMKRAWVIGALLIIALAACGGDDKSSQDDKATSVNNADNGGAALTQDATRTPRPTATLRRPTPTPHDPAPRSLPVPEGDPYTFEAPFSAGSFVRQTMRGNVTSRQTGGLQATYALDQFTVALTIYRLDQVAQAVETVRFALEGASVTKAIQEPYYGPAIAYGVVQVRSGATMAAWSHYEWAFIAQTSGPVDVLNEFLRVFPY